MFSKLSRSVRSLSKALPKSFPSTRVLTRNVSSFASKPIEVAASSSSSKFLPLAAFAVAGLSIYIFGDRDQAESAPLSQKKPVVVCVTGAAGQIGYNILFQIAQGRLLGENTPIELRLLDLPSFEKNLNGIAMELQDIASPLLKKVTTTSDLKTAFEGCEIALLIGARPRGPGMERKDLLKVNAEIFANQGKALNQYADRNCKVLVVGNPANTNCLIAQQNAPNLKKENFSAMTRLDQNRAQAMLAKKLGLSPQQVQNVIIWGNHSATQYVDANQAMAISAPDFDKITPIRALVADDKWLKEDYLKSIQQRGAEIIAATGRSSAASAASSACDHVRDWVKGTDQGQVVSMAVVSDGSYGVPEGLVFSFPVTCQNGNYEIVKGFKLDEFSKEKIKLTTEELLQERKDALGF